MLIIYTFITLLSTSVMSHTWLLNPTSRYQSTCLPAYDNSNCCAQRPSSISTSYSRGQIVSTSWGRNNHVGGFIRYSIVPIDQSDTYGVFDDVSTVFQYNCYAPQCVGNGGGFFSGDPPGTPFNGIRCSMNIKIPDWLPDGTYTLQWRWHSGGDSFNIRNLGLVDYVACHDFNIRGGSQNTKPTCPLFIGGDASNPNTQSCEFFKSNDKNKYHVSLDELNEIAKSRHWIHELDEFTEYNEYDSDDDTYGLDTGIKKNATIKN
jgi:hypothetical protein